MTAAPAGRRRLLSGEQCVRTKADARGGGGGGAPQLCRRVPNSHASNNVSAVDRAGDPPGEALDAADDRGQQAGHRLRATTASAAARTSPQRDRRGKPTRSSPHQRRARRRPRCGARMLRAAADKCAQESSARREARERSLRRPHRVVSGRHASEGPAELREDFNMPNVRTKRQVTESSS